MRKIPFAGIELTSQRVRRLRGAYWATGVDRLFTLAICVIIREYGDEQADAGRDGWTRLARPNSQARTGTGEYSFSLFSWPRAGLATLPGLSILCYMWWPYIHTMICNKNFSTTDSVPVDVVYRRAVPLFHKPSRAILQLGSSEGVNLRVWVCAPPEAHRVSSISRCKLYWECSWHLTKGNGSVEVG